MDSTQPHDQQCPPGVKGKQAADVQVSPVRLLVQSQMARNDEGKEMTQMGVGNLVVVTELRLYGNQLLLA